MKKFYCMSMISPRAPRFVHDTFESALKEAKRIEQVSDGEVLILEVVGRIYKKEIPVITRVTTIDIDDRFDDLPF